jgi:carbamoyl-phosphate synthase/aspartate carbamoyltransferase/dihydroorotase
VEWTFEDIDSSGGELSHLADFLARKQFDLVINLPMRNGGARRVSSFMTHGYRTRRLAVDYSVPLITDVKCTKMLVLVGMPPLWSPLFFVPKGLDMLYKQILKYIVHL